MEEGKLRENKYWDKVAHRFDPMYYDRFLDFCDRIDVPGMLFDNIHITGVEGLRNFQNKQLNYFSNHLSMSDYLIQSYVYWKNNLQTPLFFAGENLNVPILGKLFRRTGSYYVDREKKDRDYIRFVKQYEEWLIEGGNHKMTYVEGRRNYSGEGLLELKTAAFGAVVSYVQKGGESHGVAVGISYTNRVEEKYLDFILRHKDLRDRYMGNFKNSKRDWEDNSLSFDLLMGKLNSFLYGMGDLLPYFTRNFVQDKGDIRINFGDPFLIKDEIKGTNGKGQGKAVLAKKVRSRILKLI